MLENVKGKWSLNSPHIGELIVPIKYYFDKTPADLFST